MSDIPGQRAAQPRHHGGAMGRGVWQLWGHGQGGGSTSGEGVNRAAEERKGCSCGAGSRAWGKQGWAQLASISSSSGTGEGCAPRPRASALPPRRLPTPAVAAGHPACLRGSRCRPCFAAACAHAMGWGGWARAAGSLPSPLLALAPWFPAPSASRGWQQRCHRCCDGGRMRCPGHSPPG